MNHFRTARVEEAISAFKDSRQATNMEKDWFVLWLIDSLIDWLTISKRRATWTKESKDQQENVNEQKRAQVDVTVWIISIQKHAFKAGHLIYEKMQELETP